MLALVNSAPVLLSDVELAEVAELVPREPGEDDSSHRRAVTEALVALELRWQDLESAAIVQRTTVDLDAAWATVASRAGGEAVLQERLAAVGLSEAALRSLVRRAAVVQAYVTTRFTPFARATPQEVEEYWQRELSPALAAKGTPAPPLEQVRAEVEALLRERKLDAEIARWTAEIEKRAVVVRYFR